MASASRSDQILHQQLKRADETTLLEQGRRVEGYLWEENDRNHRIFTSLARSLKAYVEVAKEQARRFDYAQQDHQDKVLRSDGMVRHGPDCPCSCCEEGYKRLMWDVLGLPRGART